MNIYANPLNFLPSFLPSVPVTIYTESTYNEILNMNMFRCRRFKHHCATFYKDMHDSRLTSGREKLAQLLGVDEKNIKFCGIRDNLAARIVGLILLYTRHDDADFVCMKDSCQAVHD